MLIVSLARSAFARETRMERLRARRCSARLPTARATWTPNCFVVCWGICVTPSYDKAFYGKTFYDMHIIALASALLPSISPFVYNGIINQRRLPWFNLTHQSTQCWFKDGKANSYAMDGSLTDLGCLGRLSYVQAVCSLYRVLELWPERGSFQLMLPPINKILEVILICWSRPPISQIQLCHSTHTCLVQFHRIPNPVLHVQSWSLSSFAVRYNSKSTTSEVKRTSI